MYRQSAVRVLAWARAQVQKSKNYKEAIQSFYKYQKATPNPNPNPNSPIGFDVTQAVFSTRSHACKLHRTVLQVKSPRGKTWAESASQSAMSNKQANGK